MNNQKQDAGSTSNNGADEINVKELHRFKLAGTQLRKILNALQQGVQIIDFNWQYVYVNDTLVQQSMLSEKELIGFTVMEKYPGIETTPLFILLQQCMTNRKAAQTKTSFAYPDTSVKWLELCIEPVDEGLLILSTDITVLLVAAKELAFQTEEKGKRAAELIIANKELTFQNDEKEKRAVELTIANNELLFQNKEKEKRAAELIIANNELVFQNKEKEKRAAELTIANKALEQFTYIVSHNLRMPVANISAIANALNTIPLNEEKKKRLKSHLVTSINKLDEVIKDINQILQVKHTVDEQKENISFAELMADIQISIDSLIQKEAATFLLNFDEAKEIQILKSYLYSIFFNLISNSIKYRRPGISPVIEITSKKIGNKIKLMFKDNGLGIDLEKRGDQVFGLYRRFHFHTDGKGIGLYMVKVQVEMLGGKITVASQVNKGTTFTIEFNNF